MHLSGEQGSAPRLTILPGTCAQTLTTSSGSIVPVALTFLPAAAWFAVAGWTAGLASSAEYACRTPLPVTSNNATNTISSFLIAVSLLLE